ncbi:type VI secretion system-associated protein TagO [Halomonas sp. MCCC 1A17488]|uniref:Type VI secretion system-associated protein TagO n=1 Tax=Billgrantia sulfidoxydans TaxID=2733484 RepID=A0ABX7VXW6_9GAMM|nr:MULTISPECIES: type VI secretion system-associated protein VasI [Halomonas]MCE8017129.1 type VI secretion system-associated protein TagO [Halomonas sp. MCCC 1A17488]MCG3240462.1 type VI secretion system-associated protein TagO [Halomonas sp. MCCC 1A17488]QPP49678.1 type VI secretion system-associated protein TagO [Halomonas sp. SS10-MC5]QTP53288.1 type VI secretion system-associated protein TagO [Halomonas sulfidoxydans]
MSSIPTFRRAPWLALAASLTLGDAWGATTEEALVAQARECAVEPSRLERLGCYDALFMSRDEPTASEDPRPALWHTINAQEAERDGDDMGLLVRERSDSVLISVPALGSVPPRPQLVIACEKTITRFQLHLPQALDAPRVQVRLRAGGRELEQVWQARDGGYVVSGGRGLPAIATLQQLLDADELTFDSDQAALDGLRFEIAGLRQAVQPLRDACRW